MEARRLSSLPRHHVRAPAGLSRCPSLSGGASGRSTESHQRRPAHRTRTHARSGHRRRRRDSHELARHVTSSSIDPCTVRATPTRSRTPFRIKSLANGDRGARLRCLRSTAAGWVDGRRALAPSARRRKRQRAEADSGMRARAYGGFGALRHLRIAIGRSSAKVQRTRKGIRSGCGCRRHGVGAPG
jgi:hypothetical protein